MEVRGTDRVSSSRSPHNVLRLKVEGDSMVLCHLWFHSKLYLDSHKVTDLCTGDSKIFTFRHF